MNQTQKDADLDTLRERQAYIEAAEQHLNDMRSHQTRWISFARASGCTWLEIAQAIGCSPQAAEQRHAKWIERQDTAAATPDSE